VTDIEAYTKEYAPRAQALIKSSGGRILAAGQKVTALQGNPPKPRVAIIQWESMEKVQAWRDTPEFKNCGRSATSMRNSVTSRLRVCRSNLRQLTTNQRGRLSWRPRCQMSAPSTDMASSNVSRLTTVRA
jgi:uncharacterized protein (DUF1330 family)